MTKLETKMINLQRALARLREGIVAYGERPDDLMRDALIPKEHLEEEGLRDCNSPKAVLREAYTQGLVTNEEH